jgi:uncharacterized ferredoxin-like protein
MANIYVNEWPPHSPADQARRENSLVAAKLMMNAALTAPFAGGVPQIEGNIVYGSDELEQLARKMEELSHTLNNEKINHLYKYEAVMARESDVVLFIGNYRAAQTPLDAGCGLCGGKPDCGFVYEKREVIAGQIDLTDRSNKTAVNGPLCSARVNDLGYAVGSALWMATRLFVDTRPMMTMGVAGQRLGYCPNSAMVVGLPVATLSKNPYVDIGPNYHVINMQRMMDSVRKTYIISRQFGPDYRKVAPKKVKGEEVDK